MHVLGMVMGAAVKAVRCLCRKEWGLNKKKNRRKKGDLNNGERLPRYHGHDTTAGRSFSFEEMLVATRYFSRVIGFDGKRHVFRGAVVDVDRKDTDVAVKGANPSPGQSAREFRAEIEALCKLRHRHLVPLLGSCSSNEEGETLLVYRYMPRGTLRELLKSRTGAKPAMPWWRRLDACMGAARGLHCLHAGGVVHGAVKASNVLVDESWVARLSDYGLSNAAGAVKASNVLVDESWVARLSDYGLSKGATMESDVHYFGVMLFEVLLISRPGDQDVGFAEYALSCRRNGTLPDAVDPAIKDQVAPDCLQKFAETAVECLEGKGTERPAMGDVLWNLELALQLQLLDSKRT